MSYLNPLETRVFEVQVFSTSSRWVKASGLTTNIDAEFSEIAEALIFLNWYVKQQPDARIQLVMRTEAALSLTRYSTGIELTTRQIDRI